MATKKKSPLPLSENYGADAIINPVANYTMPTFPGSTQAPMPLTTPTMDEITRDSYKTWKEQQVIEANAAPKVAAASAAMSGLAAGRQVSPTTSASDAIMQTGAATISGLGQGALAGALIGTKAGTIFGAPGMAAGAAIGGLTALVAGGLQSYMGLKASRSQARKQQKLNAAIEAKNNALAARERADALEGQKYNRRTAAIQSQWQAIQAAQKHVEDILARNAELKQRFIQSGR